MSTHHTEKSQVDSSGGTQRSHSATSVVGFDMLQTGRRRRALLAAPPQTSQYWDTQASFLLPAVHSNPLKILPISVYPLCDVLRKSVQAAESSST